MRPRSSLHFTPNHITGAPFKEIDRQVIGSRNHSGCRLKTLCNSGEACRIIGLSQPYLVKLLRRKQNQLRFFDTDAGRAFLLRDVQKIQVEREKNKYRRGNL